MEQLLKAEIVGILNAIQRTTAPPLTGNEFVPVFIIISNYKFDLVDSRDGSPIQNFETGTAHYINGNVDDTILRLFVMMTFYINLFLMMAMGILM